MSKFVNRLAVLFFGLLIVLTLTACGDDVVVKDSFLSINNLVFEAIINEQTGEVTPRFDVNNDFQLYILMSDGQIISPTLTLGDDVIVTHHPTIENAFVFSIRSVEFAPTLAAQTFIGFADGMVLAGDFSLTPAISLTPGIDDVSQRILAVRNLVVPLIANSPDFSNVGLVVPVIKDGFVSQVIYPNSSLAFDLNNFDPMGVTVPDSGQVTQNNAVTIYVDGVASVYAQINTYTRRPGNNLDAPIITETAGFWDYVFIIPIAWLIALFSNWMGQSFALGILFGTIIIRTLAWPIYAKSNDAQLKMQLAQPELQRIQAKYAGKTDPASRQRQQQETMQAYKKHGISIFGCLTPLIQMPIFMAMFQVVRRITVPGGMFAERVANHSIFWGWIDLSSGGWSDWGAITLSLIVGATMFALNKLSSKKPAYMKKTGTHAVKATQAVQTERTMKIVMYVMIIFMVFASIQSNALALYWVVGNIFSIGQTLLVRKLNEKKFYKKQNEAYGIIDAKPNKKDKTKKDKNNQNNTNILEMNTTNTNTNKKNNNSNNKNKQQSNKSNNNKSRTKRR